MSRVRTRTAPPVEAAPPAPPVPSTARTRQRGTLDPSKKAIVAVTPKGHARDLAEHPISQIQWLPVTALRANDWNPNVVIAPELALIKTSLLANGWIQPILVSAAVDPKGGYEIVDGFHRATLAKTDQEVADMTGGLVPCAVLQLSEAERIMLTVRINRAKGSHNAFKMHELVVRLVKQLEVPIPVVCKGIGADKHEVDTLLVNDLFEKFDVTNTPYSKAWTPI